MPVSETRRECGPLCSAESSSDKSSIRSLWKAEHKKNTRLTIELWCFKSGVCTLAIYPGVQAGWQYLRVLGGVDDIALPVHYPVHWDPRDDIGLDELELIHKLCWSSWELWLFQWWVKRLLPSHGLTCWIQALFINTIKMAVALAGPLYNTQWRAWHPSKNKNSQHLLSLDWTENLTAEFKFHTKEVRINL